MNSAGYVMLAAGAVALGLLFLAAVACDGDGFGVLEQPGDAPAGDPWRAERLRDQACRERGCGYYDRLHRACRGCRDDEGHELLLVEQLGACDSTAECEAANDEECRKAGHGGAKPDSTTVVRKYDGSRECSSDCQSNGAVSFIACKGS